MRVTMHLRARTGLFGLFYCLFFSLFSVNLAAQSDANDQRQPAVPGERAVGIGIGTAPISMSPDSRWLWFVTSRGNAVKDLHSGDIQGIGNRSEYWRMSLGSNILQMSWSPVAPELATYVLREGRNVLSIWSPEAEAPRDLLVYPRNLYISLFPPIWSADGKTLYALVYQSLPRPKSHPDDDYPPTQSENTVIQHTRHYGEPVKRQRFEKEYEDAYAEHSRALIMAIDVATGRAGVLAKGNDIDAMYLSPDNRQLVVLQTKTKMPGKTTRMMRQVYVDMYLLDTEPVADLPTIDLHELDDRRAGWFDHRDRRLTPILTDVHMNRGMDLDFFRRDSGAATNPRLSWSPDSRRFAYATVGKQSTGDVFVYDIARAELSNLTADIELAESPKSLGYGDHYTWLHNSHKFGGFYPPLWTPDGQSLLAVGRGDVWQIPLNAKRKPRLLTRSLPQEVRRIVPSSQWNTAVLDAKGRVTLIAKDKASRMDSLWALDVRKGQSEKTADTGVWVNSMVSMDAKGERLVYTGQHGQMPRNVYQVVNGKAPELVTRYRLQLAERRYPESQVLTWQKANGETAHGLLYLPDGASAANKAPMIVDGYPAEPASQLDERAAGGHFDDVLYNRLQEGFAVLLPDIELSDEGVYEQPMEQIVEAVQKATDAALATGVIDADRLGIIGASYGGYMTQAVLTRTNRFKAAISRAGIANLYGGFAATSASVNWSLRGQGRLAVPLWKDPKRYTDNSPLSHFDQIKTPLLLIHGDRDPTVPPEFSKESFRALLHLDNPTVLASIRRLGHNVQQEIWRREQLWFREHLLGGESVSALANQGSFFLGGDLAGDKLVSESDGKEENKDKKKSGDKP